MFDAELKLQNYGYEECRPNKSFGPAIRDFYLFHYISKGKGIFRNRHGEYSLSNGQMFAIMPKESTYYEADPQDPWVYMWISFSGQGAKDVVDSLGISTSAPILDPKQENAVENILWELTSLTAMDTIADFKRRSLLYAFISELFASLPHTALNLGNPDMNRYVHAVKDHIGKNYQNDIRISDFSKLLGLDRCYLSSLFKTHMKVSIQEYLIDHRINKAIELLRKTDHSVLEISRSVGYQDQAVFSKIFKKRTGCSPVAFRKKPIKGC